MEPPNRPRLAPSLLPGEAQPAALEPEPEPPAPRRRSWWRRTKLTLLWMFLVLLLLALIPPGAVLLMRWYPPPTTAFMLRSDVKPVAYQWVPRQRIPQSLRDAVVAAEDQKFWTHWGFDFIAIAEALEHNEKSKRKRGASTITQQTAKNLFLWPSRSWLRKGLEVSFTLLLEGLWPKERILEVYLNVAEFGPGVYGVEAAAQKFFRKNSEHLTPVETAQLAAVLPNPRKWRADRPGPYVQSRVDWILVHTGQAPRFAPAPRFSVFPDGATDDAAESDAGMLPDAPADEAPAAEDDLIHDPAVEEEPDTQGAPESTDPAAPAEPSAVEPAADSRTEPQQEPEPPKEAPRY